MYLPSVYGISSAKMVNTFGLCEGGLAVEFKYDFFFWKSEIRRILCSYLWTVWRKTHEVQKKKRIYFGERTEWIICPAYEYIDFLIAQCTIPQSCLINTVNSLWATIYNSFKLQLLENIEMWIIAFYLQTVDVLS